MVQDWELLEAWRGGDKAAGDQLVGRYFEPVSRFFRSKIGDDSSDLISQTFLACMEARDRIDPKTFRGYLFAVARRRLADHFRRTSGHPNLDFSVSTLEFLGTSPTAAIARRQDAELLREAMTRLPVDDQIALELAYWEELSGREIAEALEIAENTARSRLARARVKLRAALLQLTTAERAAVAISQFEDDPSD